MVQLMRLQLAGAVLVIAALLTAELAALALAASPDSAFLWWVNLEVFRNVSATYWIADMVYPLDYTTTLMGLATLLGLSLAAYRFKVRLALAVFSNLAFLYCGALAYVSFRPFGGAAVDTASLVPVVVEFNPGGFLVLYLLVASLCGAVASHLIYFTRFSGLFPTATADA